MCVCEFPVRMRAWKWRQMVKFPHKERERERETLIQMEDSSRDPRGVVLAVTHAPYGACREGAVSYANFL